jgi:hypothetical protein
VRLTISTVCACLIVTLALPSPAVAHGKMHCKPSVGTAQVDPMVSPGAHHSAHQHTFFGNRKILTLDDPSMASYENLVGAPTACTNATDTAVYWIPTLYTAKGSLAPRAFIAYYRDFDRDERGVGVEAFPPDARLIAGDATAPTAQHKGFVNWSCSENSSRPGPYGPPVEANCAAATGKVYLTARIIFPSCWDGRLNKHHGTANTADYSGTPGAVVNHFAYVKRRACPTGFPHRLPDLRMNISWDYQGDGTDVSLSSGHPHTLHGNYWNTWVQSGLQEMIDVCINTTVPHPHDNPTLCRT